VNTAEVDTAHTLYASTPSDRTDLRLNSQQTYRFFEFVAQRAGCEADSPPTKAQPFRYGEQPAG